MLKQRPSWDEYFLKLAMLVSERSTCPRLHCGAILVKDKNVIASGYNGSLPHFPHCEDVGCMVINNHCIRTIHAEMNSILQAAKQGHSMDGCTAYITNIPCTPCANALIAAGIKRIVVFGDFHDTMALSIFDQANIPVDIIPEPQKQIHYDTKTYSSSQGKKNGTTTQA